MFSKRAAWHAPLNRLTIERRKRGDLLDLTETNPTRAGIDYPHDELADALARAARASYDPDPRGLRSAREALAQMTAPHPALRATLSPQAGRGATTGGCPSPWRGATTGGGPSPWRGAMTGGGPSPRLRGEGGRRPDEGHADPDDYILTASTSEAYSFLFKLLADRGDEILTPAPSYPLLEHLASLELVELRHFALEFHRRWEIHDLPIGERTRAIVVVNPNNPTGSFVTREEQDRIAALGLPVISDEVFLDYPLEASGSSFVRDDVLTFTLGGLSKSAGLPHYKLAWIRVSGPGKREALEALELIADNFLSVATPVQVALPELLRIAPRIRDAIRARTRANLATLRAANMPSAQVLPVEGGWSAVIRVPRVMPDEELALALLDRGVVVQPGYFFDFPEGYLVVSLLPREETFAEGVTRIASALDT